MNTLEKRSVTSHVAGAAGEGLGTSALIGSVLSGLIIGFLLDRWLDTDPWFTIGFVLLGSYSGFRGMWRYANIVGEREEEERRHARD